MGKRIAIWMLAVGLMGFLPSDMRAETTARAAAIVELTTGRVLYSFNEEECLPMASTTKIMTALVALEEGNLDDLVAAGENAYGVPGTSIYLSKGEKLTLEQMLYGLMMASGNDAAVAIAEHIGGSVEGFSELMNRKAAELGAERTHFVTPHGLPAENHYTTALDLANIAREAMQYPVFREIVSTQRASIPWEGREYNRVLKNKNQLLSTYEGATGIKTGYTKAAGRCLAFGARRNGMEIVGVVLNCGNWFEESARLMDAVFEQYTWVQVLQDGQDCGEIPVEGGIVPSVRVCAQGELAAPLDADETPEIRYELAEAVKAPLPSGVQVGRAVLMIANEEVADTPLVLAEPVLLPESVLNRISRCWPLDSVSGR